LRHAATCHITQYEKLIRAAFFARNRSIGTRNALGAARSDGGCEFIGISGTAIEFESQLYKTQKIGVVKISKPSHILASVRQKIPRARVAESGSRRQWQQEVAA
jgi:hypothetical protein